MATTDGDFDFDLNFGDQLIDPFDNDAPDISSRNPDLDLDTDKGEVTFDEDRWDDRPIVRPYEGDISPTGKGDITPKDIFDAGKSALDKVLEIVKESQKPRGEPEPRPKKPVADVIDVEDIKVKVPTGGKTTADNKSDKVLDQIKALVEARRRDL